MRSGKICHIVDLNMKILDNSKKILLAHPGTQHSHQLAKQLVRYNTLFEFWTGLAFTQDSWQNQIIQTFVPAALSKRIANRIIEDVPTKHLHTMPWLEWKALRQLQKGKLDKQIFFERNKTFQERIPVNSIEQSTAIIGFDTSSWILAKRSQDMNKPYFLDQTISHPRTKAVILNAVAKRYPEWEDDIEPSDSHMLSCEEQEYELATKIIVPSVYTGQTLVSQGVPNDKIIVNPFGVNLDFFQPSLYPYSIERPLRFIFLGAVMARKGVPLLLEAWRALRLQQCELWVIGPIRPQVRSLIPDLPGLKIWGKVPHHQLPEIMCQCDVFVFPSYCEGLPRVLLEALACGLPAITTDAVTDASIVKDGQEGFIIPPGNLEALCAAMSYFVKNPEKIAPMSTAARKRAESFSWDAYGDRWQQILYSSI